MIYERLKDRLLELLRAPRQPPEAPVGSPESVQIFQAAPNFLKYKLILWGFSFRVVLITQIGYLVFEHMTGLTVESVSLGYATIALVYALLFLTLAASASKYFLIRLDYDMRYYVVTDRSLRIREGALFINESTFTFANVQNLQIRQGPLERLLGISNLAVETAGGAGSSSSEGQSRMPFSRGHEGLLRGIANAPEVRDQILDLLKRYRDSGLGDPEERGRELAAHPAPRGFSPAAVERLREIREELRSLRQT